MNEDLEIYIFFFIFYFFIFFLKIFWYDRQTCKHTRTHTDPPCRNVTALCLLLWRASPIHGERYGQPEGGGGGGPSLLVYSTHTPSVLHADWQVTYVLTRTIWCSQTVPAMYVRVCVFVCLFKLWQFSLRSIISYTDTDTDEWKMNEK